MLTEDYCDFETAKLLKEKGFDEYTAMVYNQNRSFMPNGAIEDTYQTFYSAPTHQMTMKWLLKKYNIFICIVFLEESDEYGYTIENIIEKKYITTSKNSSYKEPEEACEEAIKYCLENLI